MLIIDIVIVVASIVAIVCIGIPIAAYRLMDEGERGESDEDRSTTEWGEEEIEIEMEME